MFYALRYLPRVPLSRRKHIFTVGRWFEPADAEAARAAQPNASDLEVVMRDGAGGGVG